MHKPEALLQDRIRGPLPRAAGPPHLPEPSRRRQARTLTEPGAGRDRGGRARQLRLSTAAASRPAAPLRAAARSAARSPAAAAAASPPWRGEAAERGLGGRLRWRRGPGVCARCPRESLSAPHSPQPHSQRGLGCKALRHWPLRGGRWFADARRASRKKSSQKPLLGWQLGGPRGKVPPCKCWAMTVIGLPSASI